MDFVKKVKGFLSKPSKTFDASYGDTLNEAVTYFMILTVISSALSALLFVFTRRGITGTIFGIVFGGDALSIFMASFIIGIIRAFIVGLILHIGVYIVGGRKGITQTMKAYMYGSTPGLLFGWIPILLLGRIPIVIVISAIWSLILHIGVYIAGGRKGITQTMKAYMYGSTPGLLFGWIPILLLGRIPIVIVISAIWSLILSIIGIHRLHGITIGRAFLAILVTDVVTFLLIIRHIVRPFF
jgi:hypothetical protein